MNMEKGHTFIFSFPMGQHMCGGGFIGIRYWLIATAIAFVVSVVRPSLIWLVFIPTGYYFLKWLLIFLPDKSRIVYHFTYFSLEPWINRSEPQQYLKFREASYYRNMGCILFNYAFVKFQLLERDADGNYETYMMVSKWSKFNAFMRNKGVKMKWDRSAMLG